jgi:hypothetical protein
MYRTKPARLMMPPVLGYLIVLAGVCAQTTAPSHPQEIILTQQSPQALFPLDEAWVKAGKTIVSVGMVEVHNPDSAGFSVAVSLSGCSANNGQPEIPAGSLGVYPAGEAGGWYALDLGPALKRIRTAGQSARATCLKLLLKPFRPTADWSKLRVTVSPPQWKDPPASTK